MLSTIAAIIHYVFQGYIILLFIRVIGSWFPRFSQSKMMRFVAFYTDPYLNFFRRIIPPIGGRLDLSPLLAFFALRIAEGVMLRILL